MVSYPPLITLLEDTYPAFPLLLKEAAHTFSWISVETIGRRNEFMASLLWLLVFTPPGT